MRDDVRCRYDYIQEIITEHHAAAMEYMTGPTVAEHFRRLGLGDDGLLFPDSAKAELLADLAVHTAKEGRSRAIERHARHARHAASSDEARVLAALCRARFSIWRIERRHEIAGAIVSDLLRGGETWLADADLEDDPVGGTFAARLCQPEQFAVACSLILPVDREMMEAVGADPLAFRHRDPEAVAEDPRFATAIYRTAIAFGALDAADTPASAASEQTDVPAIGVAGKHVLLFDLSA